MTKRDPLFVDANVSTGLPAYGAQELRGALNGFQSGVFASGDFKVTPSAGLSVVSAAGRATVAATGAGLIYDGMYYVVGDSQEDTTQTSFERAGGGTGIPANASTNPRLDAAILHVYDDQVDGSLRREWVRQYVPGVAASGAALGGTLPTIPANSLVIAEVLVPANNPTSIPSTNIRDRRPSAKGLYASAAGTTSGPTVTSGTAAVLAEMQVSGEFSGKPVSLGFESPIFADTGGASVQVEARLDGVALSNGVRNYDFPNSFKALPCSIRTDFTPAPGWHTVAIYWFRSAGSGSLNATGTQRFLSVREVA